VHVQDQVYEVFRQEAEGEPLRHAGSVDAPDETLAIQYAREVYSRRGEALRLWVVPRSAIAEVVDEDFLHPIIERTYRMGEGYRVTVVKRRTLKAELTDES
jgi:ring-1,2-phenylacetyl-CoA epoxidase subunit PaaB